MCLHCSITGKHRMAEVKWNHTASGLEKYRKENVLPVVIVRDPLAWMQSMCGNPYAAHWRHEKHHCPNMIPNEADKTSFRHLKDVFSVKVNFDKNSKYDFDSLAQLWSEWHLQYADADYPLLFSTSVLLLACHFCLVPLRNPPHAIYLAFFLLFPLLLFTVRFEE